MSSPTPLSSSRWSTKDLNGDGGVIKTVLQDGESWEQPKAEDEVRVEYKVYYNKELVLSSPEGGMEFCSKDLLFLHQLKLLSSSGVLPAFASCVTSMKKGERSKVSIGPEYGFGDQGLPEKGVPPGARLKADLTLVGWKTVKVLEGNIRVKMLEEKEGYQKPNEG